MRTSHAFRSTSLTSRALLAIVLAVLATSSGQAPVRAQQPSAASASGAAGQSATELPDGRWLLIGGEQTPGLVQIRGLDGTVATLPVSPLISRAWHTATLLSDGSVLIAGGIDPRKHVLTAPERFIPGTETFEALPADGLAPRAHHTATLLTDGRVLIVGGEAADLRDDADVWEPASQSAQPVGSRLEAAREGHASTLLADGRVWLSGGRTTNGSTPPAEIFDPSTNQFQTSLTALGDPDALYATYVNPANGATDVPPDTTIALRFSRTADVRSFSDDAVALIGPDGPLATLLVPAEGGRLLFVHPVAPLQTSTRYAVSILGVTAQGRTVSPATFSFTTKAADETSQTQPDGEVWTPNSAGWRMNAGPSPWQSLPPRTAGPGVTALSGQVLRLDGRPLADVTLAIDAFQARSDESGRFLLVLPSTESGRRQLEIKGETANRPGRAYGFFEAGLTVTPARTNVLSYTIWMPRLDTAHTVRIASPTTSETVVTTPFIPGLELHLPPGTVIKDDDGNVVRELSITPIPVDRPPFPLPAAIEVPIYFTIQPGGAYVYNVNVPGPTGAQLVYPNYNHLATGVIGSFYHYDPKVLDWYIYGWGTVRGPQVFPSQTTRIYSFTGAMFFHGSSPAGSAPWFGPLSADPVDPATGLYVMEKTDLYLPDVMPISLRRTYRPADPDSRPFGIGQTQDYAMFLWSAHQYTEADLVLSDSKRVHYVRTSGGSGFTDAVFEHTATPTRFYKSTIVWNGNGWNLTLKDGTVYIFGNEAPLQAIRDRFGNEIDVTWSSTNFYGSGVGNITRVTSPNGRWIAFTYDSASPVNRVTQASDNIGRTISYTYDANGNLSTVTDPENNVTTYSWDASHRLVSIKDGRNITWLTNQYDTSNRVTMQTLADPSATYAFAYTTDGNGSITQTDVTDPRGHVERLAFNADHYIVTDTEAYGTNLQRTTTFTRQPSGDFVTAAVDPLDRETDYTYDTNGHLLTTTKLAGTPGAVTTTYTYEQTFFQLASITDPLNHTWSLSYDTNGRLTGTTDPLGHQTAVSLNPAGQIAQITDPLQHMWQFGYTTGDLTSSTDPLGSVWNQFVDAAGRTVSMMDPLGRMSRSAYDKLNRLTAMTDPIGGVTSFAYDPNGNFLSVTDGLTHSTSYSYDDNDRIASRTDPLTHTATYTYDVNDHLSQETDRKGQITAYAYDALDRLTLVTFSDLSTISYTYDAGDRVTQIADSANGTISRQYDNLDRLTEETTPQGTVDYGYDADGRRTSMTVTGQTAITYGYDDAHRLTSITKGTAIASLTYDAASRRATLTYPNGIVVTYSYDNANHLVGIGFTVGQTTLGDLSYTYDAAGNRVTVGGSWARANLPPALASATYDAADRVISWAGVSSTYDLNGNLTNDGTNAYTWDARNRLTAISGGTTATFAYDALARRRSKTLSGATTNFLYDGISLVQELAGGSPTANLLGGPGIDEILTRTDNVGTTSLLADALGSTVALADASGIIQSSYTYEPFGQATVTGAATSNSITFTGREEDGTGLDSFRARYYDPRRQRFLSEDPLEFAGGDFNLYSYVSNSPTRFTDPTGLFPLRLTLGHPCAPPMPGRKDPWWGPIVRFSCMQVMVVPDVWVGPFPSFPTLPPWFPHLGPGGPPPAPPKAPGWPGWDPTQAPPGTEWRGRPGSTPGGPDGNYYDPRTGESYHPDLNHPGPIGPHWDWKDPTGQWWRIFPNGTSLPK